MEKEIFKILKDLGYEPSLDDGKLNKYEKALANYLGREVYDEFWELRNSPPPPGMKIEDVLLNYIDDDLKFLRLVFSSQIKISIQFLLELTRIIKLKNITPKSILELGCADGWAMIFLKDKILPKSHYTGIDNSINWDLAVNSDKFSFIKESYANFRNPEKYDFIFSILGAGTIGIDELVKCASENLLPGGHLFLGIRIANGKDYINFINCAYKYGLNIESDFSSRIHIYNQKLPYIFLTKPKDSSELIKITNNERLKLSRICFQNIEPEKRLFGYEAEIMLSLISSGKVISDKRLDWQTGEWLRLRVIEKEEINYRITNNNQGDIVIEYPVDAKDIRSIPEAQVEHINFNSSDFWSSSI